MRTAINDSGKPKEIADGVEDVKVAALPCAWRSQRLKYSGRMLPAIAKMSDKSIAHILRKRQDAVAVGLRTSHSEITVLPVNIAWSQIGDFL